MNDINIRTDYTSDCEALKAVFNTWDDRERLIVGVPTDQSSKANKSQISDGGLSTMAMERSFRVMGQMSTGQVKAIGQKDKGKALLMDLIIQRHVIPNANWGADFLTKLRQWNFYSQVYGMMPMLYDWRVREDGYIGPDCRLIPIRDFTPQRGRTSMNDMDYVYVDTYHSVRELEAEMKRKDTNWDTKVLKDVIKAARAGDIDKTYIKMSAIERARAKAVGVSQGKGDGARIRLTTKYWSGKDGKWQTFAPDYGFQLCREIENPHGTGRIPVVLKEAFPLVDSLYGLGDFERGESLQKAGDALTNLYFDAVKMSIYRPMIVNPNGVVPHTLKYQAGARWLETIPNSIRAFETSPQGMNTFNSTIGYIKGALNNQSGTTDTMVTSESSHDPQFGKTPAALAKQQARESSRDNWDRYFMEQAIENLLDGFCHLVASRHDTPIELTLFGQEIAQIQNLYPDVKDLLEVSDSGANATMRLSPKMTAGVDYKYYVDSGSTKARDDEAQYEAVSEAIGMFSKIPNLEMSLAAQGKQFDFANAFEVLLRTGGVEDIEKLVHAIQNAPGGAGQSADAQGDKPQGKPPIENINYKDAPTDIRRQMEQQAGLQPSQMEQVAPAHVPLLQAAQAAQGQAQPEAPQKASVIAHGHHFTDPHVAAAAKAMFGSGDAAAGIPGAVELPTQ